MNVLISGARAPASLELARILSQGNHSVFLADSVLFPVSRFCRSIKKFFRVAAVHPDVSIFVRDVQQLVDDLQIDLLIPTCEEIFAIAPNREKFSCTVLCDQFEKLDALHNKFAMTRHSFCSDVQPPETQFVDSRDRLTELLSKHGDWDQWVLKPVYSRFADQTIIAPNLKQLSKIEISKEKPWVVQRKIEGNEFSSFSLADHGTLTAHACYFSRYRVGIGAGIHLENVDHQRILNFLKGFVSDTSFHGQIGFDFIEDSQKRLWIIEANPRASNGWHFLAECPEQMLRHLENLVHSSDTPAADQTEVALPTAGNRKMIAFAMPIWGLASSFRSGRVLSFIPDFIRAQDVFFRWYDPLPFLLGVPLGLAEVFWTSFRHRVPPRRATYMDFEFNGRLSSTELTQANQ